MLKKILFLIVLFPLVSLTNIAISDIIPLIKPSQTTEETEKKLLIDVLKPLPKPIKKTQKKKIEVLNLGVGGYGTDQAYLKYILTKKNLDADMVLIGYMSDNLNRNVNTFRTFYTTLFFITWVLLG